MRVAGAPLGQAGWLEFYPEVHTVGDPAYARIAADGAFRAEQVPVGRVQVRLKLAAPERLPRAAWQRAGAAHGIASTLQLDVPAAGRRFDLDLAAP